jgi:thiopurine S-methyltransferase
MDPAFWRERWQQGRIGFHEARVNAFLERHLDRLAGDSRVLVPMCGKSEDLAFLAAHGHEVIGVELVEDAVRAFWAEHGLEPRIAVRDSFTEYAAPSITMLAGDMFATTRELLGPIDAIYDRAALVALPDELRRRYVDHLRTLLPKRLLIVTYEYDQTKMAGPPFSVTEAELRVLFDGAEIELLSEAPDQRMRDNAPPAMERCFAITLARP